MVERVNLAGDGRGCDGRRNLRKIKLGCYSGGETPKTGDDGDRECMGDHAQKNADPNLGRK